MSYFSPRVIAYTPKDPNNYVCPATSAGAYKAPRFSLFPSVLRDKKTLTNDPASGRNLLVPHKDTKTATAHSIARIASVLFAAIATLGLGALAVTMIYFPAVLIPSTVLILGGCIGAYYLVALLIATISKVTLKNEMIQKPKELKQPAYTLDPTSDSCTTVRKPKIGTKPVAGVAYVETTPETKANTQISLYEPNQVEVARGHRIARITATALTTIAQIALATFIGLIVFNPAAIIFPIAIGAGVIAGVFVTAFIIHLISKKTLKNEVVPIVQEDVQVTSYDVNAGKEKALDLYKYAADWGTKEVKNTYYVSKDDFREIGQYKDNFQLTKEFIDANHVNNVNNRNVASVWGENSIFYKLGYFFFSWV